MRGHGVVQFNTTASRSLATLAKKISSAVLALEVLKGSRCRAARTYWLSIRHYTVPVWSMQVVTVFFTSRISRSTLRTTQAWERPSVSIIQLKDHEMSSWWFMWSIQHGIDRQVYRIPSPLDASILGAYPIAEIRRNAYFWTVPRPRPDGVVGLSLSDVCNVLHETRMRPTKSFCRAKLPVGFTTEFRQ